MSITVNKSFTYIYPMIKDIVNYENNLLGCYIKDLNRPEYDNHIFLRYKFEGFAKSLYSKFEDKIADCELLETFYDVPIDGGDTVMFVFKVPEEYQEDYNNFLQSKYSKLSDNYKKKIISYHGATNSKNAAFLESILYKHPERRKLVEERIGRKLRDDNELSEKWLSSKEFFHTLTYTFEQLIKDMKKK